MSTAAGAPACGLLGRAWELAALLDFASDGSHADMFVLARLTGGRPLSTLALSLLKHRGLVQHFHLHEQKLICFLEAVEQGYDEQLPFHNATHAASVLQATHGLLKLGDLEAAAAGALGPEACDPQLAVLACLLAATVHDYEHGGVTNGFLVRTRHERAARYGGQHVNEHHHVAAAFELLRRPECNFLDSLPAKDHEQLRALVQPLVLGTDMAVGDRILEDCALARGRARRSAGREALEPATAKDAQLLLQVMIKCADIGHVATDWAVHVHWVARLEEELFRQGDREKALGLEPVSFLMDRSKPGVSKTQTGFFEGCAVPMFRVLVAAAPAAAPALLATEANARRWRAVEDTTGRPS